MRRLSRWAQWNPMGPYKKKEEVVSTEDALLLTLNMEKGIHPFNEPKNAGNL